MCIGVFVCLCVYCKCVCVGELSTDLDFFSFNLLSCPLSVALSDRLVSKSLDLSIPSKDVSSKDLQLYVHSSPTHSSSPHLTPIQGWLLTFNLFLPPPLLSFSWTDPLIRFLNHTPHLNSKPSSVFNSLLYPFASSWSSNLLTSLLVLVIVFILNLGRRVFFFFFYSISYTRPNMSLSSS